MNWCNRLGDNRHAESQLLDWSPACVGIVLSHRGAQSDGVRPEVLLVNDAVLSAEKGFNAAVTVICRPGDHRMAGDHVAVDEVGIGAARRRWPLRGEDPEVVAVVGLWLFVRALGEIGVLDQASSGEMSAWPSACQ